MKKEIIFIALVLLIGSQSVFSRSYNTDKRESVNLSGVNEIVFDLRGPKCALCIGSIDLSADFRGDGSGNSLDLEMSGDVTSNRRKAVPSIITDKKGRTVIIRVYPENQTFFGLSQRGSVRLDGIVPSSFNGKIRAVMSSGDMAVHSFSVENMTLDSSSGKITAEDIRGELISMEVSSGDIEAERLTVIDELKIRSSSGDLSLDDLSGENIIVKASSGEMTLGTVLAAGLLDVHSSSGSIRADQLTGGELLLKATSGKITVETVEAVRGRISASSGDIVLHSAVAGDLELVLSSGDLEMGTLKSDTTSIKTSGDSTIENAAGAITYRGSSGKISLKMAQLDAPVDIDLSSGDINLTLPRNSAFDLQMDTSSGSKNSDFDILGIISDDDTVKGTVNGGGVSVKLETSSGDIELMKE